MQTMQVCGGVWSAVRTLQVAQQRQGETGESSETNTQSLCLSVTYFLLIIYSMKT